MRYRLVLFDFDGTLADSFPTFLAMLREMPARFGLREIEPGEVAALRGLGAREVIRRLGIPLWKVPGIARWARERMAADPAGIALFPGVAESLRTLAESGVKLGIVSSNSEENIRAILGPDQARLIGVFECGASLFRKARRFRKALQRTGIGAGETITVGDEIRDLEAAREAGIAFGAVAWGYTDAEALRALAPAFLFHQPAEIAARLLP